MSSTQYISDASTRHQVFLQRYGAGQSKEAVRALNRLRRDIMARLAQEPTQFQAQRLTAVLKDIEELSALAFKDMATNIKFGAMQLAANEAEFSAQLYNRATSANFSLPSEGALLAAVEIAPMTAPIGHKAITIDEALQAFGIKKAKQIVQTITDGVVLGDTTPVISRKLSETITTLQRRQLDTLVRTITNHVSSVSRAALYEANSDIINGYKWISTLDNRTTLICASRDGKTYPVGGPLPPAHWGACVENTLITTKRGKIPIQDVKVGDYALTHSGRWKRVNAIMAKPEKCKIVRLMDNLGASVRLTMDHPVLTSIGYKAAGDIKAGSKLFNYGHQFKWLKLCASSPVKQRVLIDAHNMKTDIVERLVAYSVTSLTAGVSASVKLNGYIANNKIGDIVTNSYLSIKGYIVRFKEVAENLLMKCKIIFKGGSK